MYYVSFNKGKSFFTGIHFNCRLSFKQTLWPTNIILTYQLQILSFTLTCFLVTKLSHLNSKINVKSFFVTPSFTVWNGETYIPYNTHVMQFNTNLILNKDTCIIKKQYKKSMKSFALQLGKNYILSRPLTKQRDATIVYII